MRIYACLLLGLCLLLPVLAEDGVASGSGYLYPATVAIPSYVLAPEPGRLVERRECDLKGPVRRVCDKMGKPGRLETLWVEEYDRQGRVTRYEQHDSEGLLYTTTISYARTGERLEHMSGSTYQWERRYTAAGRLLSETCRRRFTAGGAMAPCEKNSYRYDAAGRQLEAQTWRYYPPGDRKAATGHVVREIDVVGRLISVLSDYGYGATVTAYRYDARGRIAVIRTTAKSGVLRDEETFSYDPAGRLLRRETKDAAGKRLAAQVYQYDTAGRLLSSEDYGWSREVVRADGAIISKAAVLQKGDAPLRLRTVHSYDGSGKLQETAHFDGAGAPCYQTLPTMRYLSSRAGAAFSYVRYRYDPAGAPRWTAYRTDGTPVRDRFFTTRIASPDPHPPTPHYTTDRHGNWIKETYGNSLRVREIRYWE